MIGLCIFDFFERGNFLFDKLLIQVVSLVFENYTLNCDGHSYIIDKLPVRSFLPLYTREVKPRPI